MSSLRNFSSFWPICENLEQIQSMSFTSKTVQNFSNMFPSLNPDSIPSKTRTRSKEFKKFSKKSKKSDKSEQETWKFFIEFEDSDLKSSFTCFADSNQYLDFGDKQLLGDDDCETESEEIEDSQDLLCWDIEKCLSLYSLNNFR